MPTTAPTSGAQSTSVADIEANAASFARHLRAAHSALCRVLLGGTRVDDGLFFESYSPMARRVGALSRWSPSRDVPPLADR